MTLQVIERDSLKAAPVTTELQGQSIYGPKDPWQVTGESLRVGEAKYALMEKATAWIPQGHVPLVPPRPHISQEARSLVTDRVETLLDTLIPMLYSAVLQSHISLSRIRYVDYQYPEENSRELQIEVYIEANMAQAIALWREVGKRIDAWKKRLKPAMARLLSEIGIQFYWTR